MSDKGSQQRRVQPRGSGSNVRHKPSRARDRPHTPLRRARPVRLAAHALSAAVPGELLAHEVVVQPEVQLALTNTTRLSESADRFSRAAESVSHTAAQLPDRHLRGAESDPGRA